MKLCLCDDCRAAAEHGRCQSEQIRELQATNTKLVQDNRVLAAQTQAQLDVAAETARAIAKHGSNRYTDFESLCILTEEVGEVAQVLCRLYVPPIGAGVVPERERQNLRAELVQVASVTMRWIDRIDKVQTPIPGPSPVNGGREAERTGSPAAGSAEYGEVVHRYPDGTTVVNPMPVDAPASRSGLDVPCGNPTCAVCEARQRDAKGGQTHD